MTNKHNITEWLNRALPGSALDSTLRGIGFSRQDRTLCYQRRLPEIMQEFKIIFDTSPRYDPSAIAHVLPQVVLNSQMIGDVVQRMTGGDPQLVGIGDTGMMLRHQLQNLAPKGNHRQQGSHWFIRSETDTPAVIAQIGEFVAAWAIPFVEQYGDIESITRGYESSDERLRLDRRFYLYVAAAYVHIGRPEKAREVLEQWLGRPATRKQYGRAFEYVEQLMA